MKNNKLFTWIDVVIGLCAAIGGGIGFSLSKAFELGFIFDFILPLITGISLDLIIIKLFKSKLYATKARKIVFFIVLFIVFALIAVFESVYLDHSLLEDFANASMLTIGLPVGIFALTFLIKFYSTWTVKSRFGTGEEGVSITEDEKKSYARSIDGQNEVIDGEYNKLLAVETNSGTFVGRVHTSQNQNLKDKMSSVGKNLSKIISQSGAVVEYLGIPYKKKCGVQEAYFFGPSPKLSDNSILKYHNQSDDCQSINIWRGIGMKDPLGKAFGLVDTISKTTKSDNEKKISGQDLEATDFGLGLDLEVNSVKDAKNLAGQAKNLISKEAKSAFKTVVKKQAVSEGDVASAEEKRPVLVIIPPESSAQPLYNGEKFAAKHPDVLIVSMNPVDIDDGVKWIKDNIASFGGDPNNITLFGDSSLLSKDYKSIVFAQKTLQEDDIKYNQDCIVCIPSSESGAYIMQFGVNGAKDFDDEKFIKSYIDYCKKNKKSRCLYWNVMSPIEKFGANHFGLLLNILENSEYGKLFGSVVDANIANKLQKMLINYMFDGNPSLPEDDIKWNSYDNILKVDDDGIKISKVSEVSKNF